MTVNHIGALLTPKVAMIMSSGLVFPIAELEGQPQQRVAHQPKLHTAPMVVYFHQTAPSGAHGARNSLRIKNRTLPLHRSRVP